MRGFVPFVGRGDEIAVAVARRDIGEHGRGQGARLMQLFVPLLDRAFVGEFAQQALEFGRIAFFSPKARAISRVPTLPGCLPMKARMSALEGREGVRLVFLFKMEVRRQNGAVK